MIKLLVSLQKKDIMKVKQEYGRMPANEVWNEVVDYINKNKQLLSTTGLDTMLRQQVIL